MHIDLREVDRIIDMAINEDVGKGDITTRAIISSKQHCSFTITAKEPMVICGLGIAIRVFEKVGEIRFKVLTQEAQYVEAGTVLLEGKGPAHAVLLAERTALNIMQHLSGISTLTQQFVKAVEGTRARILDTRKTTPGLRHIEKYAVRTGGGHSHRLGLDDGVLIKDNHIAIAGSIKTAIENAINNTPSLTKIEVECDTLEQVKEALTTNVDVIMLDNMDNATMKKAVALANGKVELEASGNVNLDTVTGIAKTGVDYISIGKLTHSAPNMDISLNMTMESTEK